MKTETFTRSTESSLIPRTQTSSGSSLSGDRIVGGLEDEEADGELEPEVEGEPESEAVDYPTMAETRDQQTSTLDLVRRQATGSRRGERAVPRVTWVTRQNYRRSDRPLRRERISV